MSADIPERRALGGRDLEIFRLRFGHEDGRIPTQEEVGEAFGITPERVRQIEAKIRTNLVPPQLYRTPDGLGVIEWVIEDGIRRQKVTRSRPVISIVLVEDAGDSWRVKIRLDPAEESTDAMAVLPSQLVDKSSGTITSE
jgi:hypothetical protein